MLRNSKIVMSHINKNYEQIFENLPDPIFVTDANGNVLLSNSGTAMALDLTLDQLLKENVKDMVRKGFYDVTYSMKAAADKTVSSGLINTRTNLQWISTSTPVLDDKGNVKLVVTSARPKELIKKFVYEDERKFNDQQKREIEYLRNYVLDNEEIVAESRLMRQVLLAAHTVAQTDSTVVLFGESGTGKEVLAKYIHKHSKRANNAFITVNCAAFPENLVESEMFGYEKGAFTGANSEGKVGLFEAAEGGTIFLDEIAEMPLQLQAKLLRVLETNEVRRIGNNVGRKINFRLIVATHKDLRQMTVEGLFRNDLYYRLNIFPITIPSLKDRPEDIVYLAQKFTQEFNKKYNLNVELDNATLESYHKYNWPGNVRELRNVIERRVICHLQDYSSQSLLAANFSTQEGQFNQIDYSKILGLSGKLNDVVRMVEESYINHVLKECGGCKSEAAKRLGIYRSVLYRKLDAFEKDKKLGKIME